MFGLGKKSTNNSSNASVDRLEALKKQLADLKAKEAELDNKAVQKPVQINPATAQVPVQPVLQGPIVPQQMQNMPQQMQNMNQQVQSQSLSSQGTPQSYGLPMQGYGPVGYQGNVVNPVSNQNSQAFYPQMSQQSGQTNQPQMNFSNYQSSGQQIPVSQIMRQSDDVSYGVGLGLSKSDSKIYPSQLNDELPMVISKDDKHDGKSPHLTGVILEIGAGMSLNIPIRSRMQIEEFIQIAERVKALSALNFERRN
jgi:hypothetical protein